MKTIARSSAIAQLEREAWIGDALLTLFARLKILREDQVIDAPKSARMTSNRFLASLGEPTHVEAEIGREYLLRGLEPAFNRIEQQLLPAFEKQEQNRRRKRMA